MVLGCSPTEPNDLTKMSTVRMTINGQAFELWIADDHESRARGLMFITADQMAPLADGTMRGMMFVFPAAMDLHFWMKNTIIPLDIAYADTGGRVTAIHTMAPLDEDSSKYGSGSPARYAIEVNANVFTGLGLKPGDMIAIPNSLLNPSP